MFEQAKITTNEIINDTECIEIEKVVIEEQEVIYFTNKNIQQLYLYIISLYDKKEVIKMAENIITNK